MDTIDVIRRLCINAWGESSSVKHLGGKQILIMLKGEAEISHILRNPRHELHLWVKSLRRWTVGYRSGERAVWLKIYGVPLHVWKEETFMAIASKWGESTKSIHCNLMQCDNLAWGKVQITTSIITRINELCSLKIDHLHYRIKVEEEDSSFSYPPTTFGDSGDANEDEDEEDSCMWSLKSKDEEEEGISKTNEEVEESQFVNENGEPQAKFVNQDLQSNMVEADGDKHHTTVPENVATGTIGKNTHPIETAPFSNGEDTKAKAKRAKDSAASSHGPNESPSAVQVDPSIIIMSTLNQNKIPDKQGHVTGILEPASQVKDGPCIPNRPFSHEVSQAHLNITPGTQNQNGVHLLRPASLGEQTNHRLSEDPQLMLGGRMSFHLLKRKARNMKRGAEGASNKQFKRKAKKRTGPVVKDTSSQKKQQEESSDSSNCGLVNDIGSKDAPKELMNFREALGINWGNHPDQVNKLENRV